jgi:acetoin utilization deacetylase AcuC-like enzyme
LENALMLIQSYMAVFPILSAGMDIYKDDALGKFEIPRDGIHKIGKMIANLNIPTLNVTEGGYDCQTVGEFFMTLLKPFSL